MFLLPGTNDAAHQREGDDPVACVDGDVLEPLSFKQRIDAQNGQGE